MSDCSEILEMLGAYALGASEPGEANLVEVHVAECVRCWEELEKEQQTVALLALAVPVEQASPRLEQRVIAAAQRDKVGVRTEPKLGLLRRLHLGWPAAAGALGFASVAAIVFSTALQMQVHDLRSENSDLSAQVQDSTLTLQQQLAQTDQELSKAQEVVAVIADDDAHAVKVDAVNQDAAAYYTWSPGSGKGFIICENMPTLTPGKVYEAWVTVQKDAYPIGTFQANDDGTCQITTDLGFLSQRPTGIGISVEAIPGALEHPTSGWFLYEHFSSN